MLALAALFVVTAAGSVRADAPTVQLAGDGEAAQPVVVSADASPRVREAAETLASYLGRISSSEFQVEQGDGMAGIAVGVAGDFPELAEVAEALDATGFDRREQYLLRSHEGGLYAIGATETAVEDAVWDLLDQLGYRMFFPSDAWEVFPDEPELAVAVDVVERPDYLSRRIWFTYSTWPENRERMARWSQRNRARDGVKLNTGHAYGHIRRAYQDRFDAHPEYNALIGGERQTHQEAKFCISNPGLRELVVERSLAQFESNPDADTVSVDPSDGGGWCECDQCAAIGTPSDQALLLANAVSEALEEAYPDEPKYVAMYAYNFHGPPPTQVEARPRVIINVATAFLKEGLTVDEIIEGWQAMGVELFGIREYYSIIHWDKDLPRAPRLSRLRSLRSQAHYHRMGARFLSAESSDNWGPTGLGYYLAGRVLWDTSQVDRLDELVDDFLEKAFGAAREPMGEFYELITGDSGSPFSEHLVGQMYRLLDEATSLNDDPAVQARIDHLILYARFLELYRAFTDASGDERQAAFEQVIRHSYRIRDTHMVHSLAQYRTGFRDSATETPEEAQWQRDEAENPWKSSEPWTRAELDTMLAEGVANNELRPFDEVDYSDDLMPAAAALGLPESDTGGSADGRGTRFFYTWIEEAPQTIELQVTGGLISWYRDRGPARVQLQQWDGDTGEYGTIDEGEREPDGETRTVTLTAPEVGRYRIRVSDGNDRTRIDWPAGLTWTVESSLRQTNTHMGRAHFYFYVPEGTESVGGYVAAGGGYMLDADGKRVLAFQGEDATPRGQFVQVPVPEGQDGRLWRLQSIAGTFQFMTVPPYLATHPQELMLPREVVERDGEAGE